MATSGLYGSSPTGATVAAPGSESAGLYGNATTFGGSYFEWFIFIQSETQPATPTGGSWSFTTNSGTAPTGWSSVPPSAPTLPVWVSIALVNSKNTTALVWSAPGVFAYSSGLPILSGAGEPSSGDGLTNQLWIQTNTTPETIWFKQAGTWTRLTGSTLYADLTSNQTIAGTKTFSSQIQGSISGTASNVTGIVGITNGGTGSTTANGALTALGGIGSLTSTDGSVTITSPTATSRNLAVVSAGSTTNVLCQVRNTTGATLTKGTVVYISGATGQIPTVSKALATSDATSAQTLGMMSADLANNSNGYVTVIGLINDIDTSAYSDGAQLYLSGTTAGTVTATKPYAPIHLVYVAVVEYAHPTQGKLFVKVQNGYELDEIHNVNAQTPSNGNTLVYNSTTSLWDATSTLSGSYTFSGGTANGVTYLNGSKVLTSGSALTFDGTLLNIGDPVFPVNATVFPLNASFNTNTAVGQNLVLRKSADAVNGAVISLTKTRGTNSSPTAINTGDTIGAVRYDVFSGTTYRTAASINAIVETYVSDTNISAALLFNTITASSSVTEKMRLDSAGNLGIGTTSPARPLDVNGSIRIADSAVVEWGGVSTAIAGSSSANTLFFYTASTERMRLDSAGNLGIGTNSPSAKLQVANGNILLSNAYYLSSRNNANTLSISMIGRNTSDQVLIDADGYGTLIGSGGVLGVFGSGNVGIGTSSPQTPLHVYGTTGITIGLANQSWQTTAIRAIDQGSAYQGTLAFYTHPSAGVAGSPTEKMRIDAAGNVGIGTTSPSAKLDVQNGQIYVSPNGSQYALGLRYNSSTNGVLLGSPSVNAFTISSWSGTEYMRFDSAGNLGIGTSSPLSKLTVAANNASAGNEQFYITGTANTQQLRIGYNTTSNYGSIQAIQIGTAYRDLVLNADGGNVGIGIAPSSRLYVGASSGKNTATVNGGSTNSGDGAELIIANGGTTYGGMGNYSAVFGGAYDNTMAVHGYWGMRFFTLAAERARIDSSGNLLVGNTSALYATGGRGLLNVNGSSSSLISLSTGGVTTSAAYLYYNGTNITLANDTSGGSLTFTTTGGTERLRIDSSGRFLLGTNSSSFSNFIVNNLSDGAPNASGNMTTGAVFAYNTGGVALQIGATSGGYTYLNSAYANNSGVAAPMLFFTGASERARIDSSGNLLVSTTSAIYSTANRGNITIGGSSSSILVLGTGTTTGGYVYFDQAVGGMEVWNGASGYLRFATSNTERARIDSSGNFLVAQTSTIYGASGRGVVEVNGGSTSIYGLNVGGTNAGYLYHDGTDLSLTNYRNGALKFAANNTEVGRFTSSGNLLVGTTSQYGSAKLSVNGSITATSGWTGTNSSAGKLGGIVQSFFCERNGVGTATQVMAFGNGSGLGKGIRMPFAGKLILATLAGTGINGTVTVDVYQNGTANSSYRLTATNGSAADIGVTQDFSSSPLSFAAGDTIGWYQTTVPSAANTYNVSFYVIFD